MAEGAARGRTATVPPHAVVLAGRGRYGDPWHDHAATSHEVALALVEAGFTASVRSTFPDALADLRPTDLLVVNAGRGPDDDVDVSPLHARVDAHAAAGGPVLALHQAANTFGDHAAWTDVVGGRWVDGTSWHPPQDVATFEVLPDHPVTAGLGPLVVDDERYTDLVVHDGVRVLVQHFEDGVTHPVVWVAPSGRAVYDGLGHGVASYTTPARRALLVREARWLVGLPPAP